MQPVMQRAALARQESSVDGLQAAPSRACNRVQAESSLSLQPLSLSEAAGRVLSNLRAVSGMKPEAFDRLFWELYRQAPFMRDGLLGRRPEWIHAFFVQLAPLLARCGKGEGVAVVLFHPDCYGVKSDDKGREIRGSGITHISVMAVSPAGELCVNHHESITFNPNVKARRGLMASSVGISCDSMDNLAQYERASRELGARVPAELPVMRSYRLWGEPKAAMDGLGSFDGFRAHTEKEVAYCAEAEGLKRLYCSDPDHIKRDGGAAAAVGRPLSAEIARAVEARASAQPVGVLPPGAERRASPLDYSNNCTLTTLLALKAGKCWSISEEIAGWISPSLPLYALHQIFHQIGLMPDTPPNLADRAYEKWTHGGDGITAAAFMIIGNTQACRPGQGISPHVPLGSELRAQRSRLAMSGASPATPQAAADPSPRLPLPRARM
jgi:hypothetical protein